MTAPRDADIANLRRLAALYGIQLAYFDVSRRRRAASPESLLAALRAWGAPLDGMRGVSAALRARQAELWEQLSGPVAVAWQGRATLEVRLPAAADRPLQCVLNLEDGKIVRWSARLDRLPVLGSAQIGRRRFLRRRLAIPGRLPPGYHAFTIHAGRRDHDVMVIAAPRRAYAPPEGDPRARTWGVFLPLYALRTRRSWGCGDLSDLETLMRWVNNLGGGVVATLPLLSAFLDEPFAPSPYVPASRLFWNELYLDPTRVPDLERCAEARALLDSTGLRAEIAHLQASSLVDYRGAMAAKRRVLEALARCLFREPSPRQEAFYRFVAARPALEDYARFRAAGERRPSGWPTWPAPLRDGVVREGDYDEETRRYHLYVQWLAHEQLRALAEKAGRHGPGLYLDLPLGVHPDGYDVWREREVFVRDASGGAPPDAFFTRGQAWGFPPLHPERPPAQRYRYFIAVIRHHLEHAGILRIDHVMGLHRLFWVPRGMEARQGVYVTYPAEDFYAILALESVRHRAVIVGEDLGTVPPGLRRTMARHNVQRMYVVQYQARPKARPLHPVPADSLAGLNTHDMPPFAAFWQGLDIRERRALRLMDGAGASRERRQREALKRAIARFLRDRGWLAARAGTASVLRGLLAYLAASPARTVIVNLEDLWLERRPQNVPGTAQERPNWRRKASLDIETFRRMPPVLAALRLVHRLRGQDRKARD